MTFLPPHLQRWTSVWRSPRLWQRRLSFLLGAVAVGLAAAWFARAADWALEVFFTLRAYSLWWASAATVPRSFSGTSGCSMLNARTLTS
ncbi:MAG: hypothetical protein HC779_08375 [Phyllobacteriaceae bacterium]|nr:hypothetical protein [Phyllobacteriaceae bacterium]